MNSMDEKNASVEKQMMKRFDQLDKKFTELFDFLDQDVRKVKQNIRKVAGKNI